METFNSINASAKAYKQQKEKTVCLLQMAPKDPKPVLGRPTLINKEKVY